MVSYNVVFKKSASRQLRKLSPDIVKRVAVRIDDLENNPFPHGVEQLKVYRDPPMYRIRVGDYRILYTVDASTNTITIFGIGHRREIYRP
ncbi:MAG TPA: type II toxin-antitoxin system RelE/ParE family toxin [Phycisphaerales bacterium]|nr:type II toxin-antitoxin system RelE/ParE family toxin [Phycisphaerales bacterium]